jgi:hypothetical protein
VTAHWRAWLPDKVLQPGKESDMRQNEARRSRRHGLGRCRLRRAVLVAVALGSVALLAAACSGGSGSSGASGNPGASSGNPGASSGNPTTGALAYSQCMRAHGVTNFPDPNSNGGISLPSNGSVNLNSPQYQAASKACQSKMTGQLSQAQQDQDYQAALKYAQCMQTHGLPDYPDPPAPGGGPNTQSHSSHSGGNTYGNGPNPNSPQFIAANKICQHYLPAGQGPSLSRNSAGGGS